MIIVFMFIVMHWIVATGIQIILEDMKPQEIFIAEINGSPLI